jgi:hypothetical protein
MQPMGRGTALLDRCSFVQPEPDSRPLGFLVLFYTA